MALIGRPGFEITYIDNQVSRNMETPQPLYAGSDSDPVHSLDVMASGGVWLDVKNQSPCILPGDLKGP